MAEHETNEHVDLELPTAQWLVPGRELRRRVAALQRRLVAADLELAVIAQNADLCYFAGSVANGWMVVPAEGEPTLHVRRAAARTAAETCFSDVRRTVSSTQLVAALRQQLGGEPRRVGLTLDVLPAAEYLKFAELLPSTEFVDVGVHVRLVRSVKSDWELGHMFAAAAQVQRAMRAVIEQVAPGMREIDAFVLAEHELRLAGHQGAMRMRRFNGEMFYGQVAAGANAALPAALDAPLGGAGLYPPVGKGASARALREGDLLVLDLMGASNGYLSDCTRVVAIGEVDDDLLAAQRWCTGLLGELERLIRPGVPGSALYEHAIGAARDSGHAMRFMGVAPDQARFVGHGVGMEVDEYPFIAPGFDEPLEEGMVFALEPKLVFPGRAAVGIEDTYIVRSDGFDVLPAIPREVALAGGH